jgi:hypothetical protein
MIHHVFIAARNPQPVGEVFAELIGDVCIPFPLNRGSSMSFARDGHGTGVEIYSADSVMRPNGEAGAEFVSSGQARPEPVRSNNQLSLQSAGCEIIHNGGPDFSAFCRRRRGAD